MSIIFIVVNVCLAIMSGTAHISRYLRANTDYYALGHKKSIMLDTFFDITYRISTLPVCFVCIGLSFACALYGIYKYFDVFFAKKIDKKPLKSFGWIVFMLIGVYNVWGIIQILFMHI